VLLAPPVFLRFRSGGSISQWPLPWAAWTRPHSSRRLGRAGGGGCASRSSLCRPATTQRRATIRRTRDARAVEQAAPKAASPAHGGHASASVATPARPRCAGGGGRKPPLQRDRAVARPPVSSARVFSLAKCIA
jgi:hypothetical protein